MYPRNDSEPLSHSTWLLRIYRIEGEPEISVGCGARKSLTRAAEVFGRQIVSSLREPTAISVSIISNSFGHSAILVDMKYRRRAMPSAAIRWDLATVRSSCKFGTTPPTGPVPWRVFGGAG